MREIPLMREFLAEFRHPRVRLFRRQIINKPVQDIHTGRVLQVKAGIVGQADVYGYIVRTNEHAIPLEVEFKGARTPTSEEQKRWRTWCIESGIPHITLRADAGEEALDTVRRWTAELSELVATLSPC